MNPAKQALAENMWAVLRVYIDPYSRKQAAESLLKSFEGIALDGLIMEAATTDPNDVEDDPALDITPLSSDDSYYCEYWE